MGFDQSVFFIKSNKKKENVSKNGCDLDKLSTMTGSRLKNVMTFLNLLLSLEKPNTILVRIAHHVIAFFNDQVSVNWGSVFYHLISGLAKEKNLYHNRGS